MKMHMKSRRGMSSVLALIYLTLLAALAVGFYSAVDVGTNLADNHQYINRSSTNAESGLAFARYQLNHLTLPAGTQASGALVAALTQLQSTLNGTANMGGNNPDLATLNGLSAIAIPGQPAGWTWSGSGAVPSNTNWMQSDSTPSGNQPQFFILITQPNTSNFNLTINTVGENVNNAAVGPTKISRQLSLGFGGAQGADQQSTTTTTSTGTSTLFQYGLVSYGQIVLNAALNVSGTNAGVLSAAATGLKPIQVNVASSINGDFYWTNSTTSNNIAWGGLTVDGIQSGASGFSNHVHGGVAAPAAPTYDTSSFASYVTAQSPGANATSLTNASLKAGNYSFNKPITINGILYLQSGAKLTFNSGVTLNGAIVQDNAASTGSVVFNSTVTQNAMPGGYPAGEEALTGDFLLLPNGTATFNGPTTSVGSIIANGMTINSSLTVNGGSIINLGSGNMTFNSGSSLTVNTNAGSSPSGVSQVTNTTTTTTTVSGSITYLPTANSYAEVGQ